MPAEAGGAGVRADTLVEREHVAGEQTRRERWNGL
jgi:hypothetical protein